MLPLPGHPTLPSVPGYHLVRKLGEGGMGQVFLARQERGQQFVAIKFFCPSNDFPQTGLAERFHREIQLTTEIVHDHLVSILDTGSQDGQPYLVMEFLEGGNLRSLLQPRSPMPLQQALPLLRQLFAAMQYLADQGIVHRDLKPENVLLTGQGHLKVADFGLATRVSSVGQLTQSGQVLGTLEYMAPEQRARLPLDERADQYSLAVIIYEMLTGRRPVGRLRPASTLARHLPRRVDAVLFRALEEDPADRFPSIQAFAADFFAALDSRPRRFLLPLLCFALILCPLLGSWLLLANLRPQVTPATDDSVLLEKKPSESPAPSPQDPLKERVQYLLKLGQQQDQKRLRKQAEASYSEAIKLHPNDPLPWIRRAYTRMWLQRHGEALVDLDEAFKLSADHPEALRVRGEIYLQLRDYSRSLRDLERAIQLDPLSALAYAHRGRVHLLTKKSALALKDFNTALQLDDQCALAYFYRGQIAQSEKRYDQALHDFQQSVQLTPDNPFAHSALASLLATCPDYAFRHAHLAVQHAEQACKLSSWRLWREMRILAQAHLEAGNPEAAAQVLEKALQVAPPTDQSSLRSLLRKIRPDHSKSTTAPTQPQTPK